MSSRERRLLDKDKEIRKLKSTAGHYFNCTIDGAIKIYKLKKALDVAVDGLNEIIDWDNCVALQANDFVNIAHKALAQINAIKGGKDE